MTTRVSEEEVRAIIDVSADITIQPFIDAANLIVSEQLSPKGMSDARLKQIELFLGAHFLTLRVRQLKSEKFGDSTDTYQSDTGMNLASSQYGQTATVLDTSGTLATLGMKPARFNLAC